MQPLFYSLGADKMGKSREETDVVVYLDHGSMDWKSAFETIKGHLVQRLEDNSQGKLIVVSPYRNSPEGSYHDTSSSGVLPSRSALEELASAVNLPDGGACETLFLDDGEAIEEGLVKGKQNKIFVVGVTHHVWETLCRLCKNSERILELWTLTLGFYSLDPSKHKDAPLLTTVTYQEAAELSTFQSAILQPKEWLLFEKENCIVKFCDIYDGDQFYGTTVTASPSSYTSTAGEVLAGWVSGEMSRLRLKVPPGSDSWQHVMDMCCNAFKRNSNNSKVEMESLGGSEVVVWFEDLTLAGEVANQASAISGCVCTSSCVYVLEIMYSSVRDAKAAIESYTKEVGTILKTSSKEIGCSSKALYLWLETSSHRLQVENQISTMVLSGWQADARLVSSGRQYTPTTRCLRGSSKESSTAFRWWCNMDRIRQLAELANNFEHPLYIMHIPSVVTKAKSLTASVGAVSKWFYAIKANSSPVVVRYLVLSGINLECVSAPEVYFCLQQLHDLQGQVKRSSVRILYVPNFCSIEELGEMISLQKELLECDGPKLEIVMDSAEVVSQIDESVIKGSDIALRVDSNVGAGHHTKVVTAGPGQKFGCNFEDAERFCTIARDRGARVIGIHSHSGSGITDPTIWSLVFNKILELVTSLKAKGHLGDLCWLDLGGGIGIPDDLHHDEVVECLNKKTGNAEKRMKSESIDLRSLQTELQSCAQRAEDLGIEIWMEPGRFFVSNPGVLLCKVTQCRTKGNRQFIGVTAGMNTLIRPALYGAYHSIVNISKPNDPSTHTATVVGPICESGDVLGIDRSLPTTSKGDIILITNGGAYGYEMRSFYNMRNPATRLHLFE